jgi:hypothetical protein
VIFDGIKAMNDFDQGYDADIKKKWSNWDEFKEQTLMDIVMKKAKTLDPPIVYKRF